MDDLPLYIIKRDDAIALVLDELRQQSDQLTEAIDAIEAIKNWRADNTMRVHQQRG